MFAKTGHVVFSKRRVNTILYLIASSGVFRANVLLWDLGLLDLSMVVGLTGINSSHPAQGHVAAVLKLKDDIAPIQSKCEQ